jgi:hypothetical protein
VRLERRAFAAALAAAAPLRAATAGGAVADGNDAYRRAYAQAAATRGVSGTLPPRLPEPVAAKLRAGRVIFVGGLMKQLAEAVSAMVAQPIGFGGYFDEQRAALEVQGIEAVELAVDSEGSVATNAVEVARAIGSGTTPVTLVTHSKGSLDTLAALIANPAFYAPPRLQAWVSLQAPFYGSPLADLNSRDLLVRTLTGYLLKEGFGGSPDTLLELRVSARRIYQRANAAAIRDVVRSVPTVCYGSWLTDEMPSLFRLTWLICRFAGERRNDGLVGVSSTHLPGAIRVEEGGVDHAMAVIEVPGTGPFDPATCLTALLGMALA